MTRSKNQLLVATVLSAVAFLSLATAVAFRLTQPFDTTALLRIHSGATPYWDSFFITITQFGGSIIVTIASILILGVLLLLKKRRKAVFFSLVMVGMLLLNILFKDLIGRHRPDAAGWLIPETGMSFPSGHATAVMALGLALCILLWNTSWRWAAVRCATAYIAVVSFSRLYLGVHYPSDIVGGWLLSIAWVSAVVLIVRLPYRHVAKVNEP